MVTAGTGILETVIPGCPDTFQEQTPEGDQHQKIHSTREGDVIVVPAASAQWIYNNGQTNLVLFSLIDTANEDNQLDLKVRVRMLSVFIHKQTIMSKCSKTLKFYSALF